MIVIMINILFALFLFFFGLAPEWDEGRCGERKKERGGGEGGNVKGKASEFVFISSIPSLCIELCSQRRRKIR